MRFKKVERSYPQIIIAKEKHGTNYYVANSENGMENIALKLLKNRFEQDFFYNPNFSKTFEEFFKEKTGVDIEDFKKKEDVLTKEEFANLNINNSGRTFSEIKKDYKSLISRQKEYDFVVKIIDEENGKSAFSILLSRNDYEYEGFEYESVEIFE